MIIIIHGDDTVSSRKYFLDQKRDITDPLTFDGEKVTITDLVQIFEGGSLFSDEKVVFIEELFKRKAGKDLSEIISYLNTAKFGNVFIWEGKTLGKSALSLFPKATHKTFTLPQSLFQFLDRMQPENKEDLVRLFRQTLKSADSELVFYMLVRQFRLLLAVFDRVEKNSIDELSRLAPWQKSKLQRQAGFFSLEKLKNLYQKLYTIDFAQKTSSSPLSLTKQIDFFLLDL